MSLREFDAALALGAHLPRVWSPTMPGSAGKQSPIQQKFAS